MYRWQEVEAHYHAKRWREFIDAVTHEVDSGWKEPHNWWAMVSRAHESLGDLAAAEGALRRGIERHPDEPLCYACLGSMLAGRSAGDATTRQEALVHWREALRRQGIPHGGSGMRESTFSYLREEIPVLEGLALDDRYPPVSPEVEKAVSGLKACGLFEDRTVAEVLWEARRTFGDRIVVRPGRRPYDTFLTMDARRYLGSDWRYAAEDVLADAAALLRPHGVEIEFRSETEPDEEGNRKVAFSMQGIAREATVDSVAALVRVVNGGLTELGAAYRFFQLRQAEQDDQYDFLLLAPSEADAIRNAKLFSIDLP